MADYQESPSLSSEGVMKKTEWMSCKETPPVRIGFYEVRLWESKKKPASYSKEKLYYFDGKAWHNNDGYPMLSEGNRPGWSEKDEWRGLIRERQGFMFVAKRPCGKVSAMVWDDTGYEESTAKTVATWVIRGDVVERLEVFKGDPVPETICKPNCNACYTCPAPTSKG